MSKENTSEGKRLSHTDQAQGGRGGGGGGSKVLCLEALAVSLDARIGIWVYHRLTSVWECDSDLPYITHMPMLRVTLDLELFSCR